MSAMRQTFLYSGLAILMCCGPARGQSSAERRLQQRLAERVTVAWRRQQLRTALTGLGQLHATPIWLDRRADPNQSIDLSVSNVPVGTVFKQAADKCELGCTFRAGVVYIGPLEAAGELATLLVKARSQLVDADAVTRRRWLVPRMLQWPRLAQPRSLVENLSEELGVALEGAEMIPLDLWPAQDELRIAPIDWLTLTLLGFDLAGRFDDEFRSLEIAPIERPVALTRSYARSKTRAARWDHALAVVPADAVEANDRGATVTAPLEVHEALARRLAKTTPQTTRPEPADPQPRGRKVYTLAIENQPLGRVLDQLAGQLKLEVVWDAADALRDEYYDVRVSCSVREATLEELLKAIVASAGLVGEVDGATLTIQAAE